MSEDTVVGKSLWSALFAVQQELKGVSKDSDNPFFKSKYADRTTILEAIRPLFSKHGLLLIQSPTPAPAQNNTGVYLGLKTVIVHVESGEAYQDVAVVPLPKADPQGFGSAVTYTSRYALTMILGLPLLDDDGNGASEPPATRATQEKKEVTPKKEPVATKKSVTGAKTEGSAEPVAPTATSKESSGENPVAGADTSMKADPKAAPTKRTLWGKPGAK